MSTQSRPSFIPSVVYRDSRAALDWLEKAFGFEVSELLTDSQGNIVHAQMAHGSGTLMIASEFADWTRSPLHVDGKNTQRVVVQLEAGLDDHCSRARRAGAQIVQEPADQFYGARTYMAVDPEGHHWSFHQAVKDVTHEEMEAASGLKFRR
ncbi:MAG TPA: VOC family protein [Steroidobacteraceae bacterium]|jgi:uncharacterized glyoxalase superfamily protein PhnB